MRTTGQRAALALGLCSLAGGAAWMFATSPRAGYSIFDSSQQFATPVSSGTVAIALASDTLSTGGANFAPGEEIERPVTLENSGTLALSTIVLTMTDASPTALVTTAAGGMT